MQIDLANWLGNRSAYDCTVYAFRCAVVFKPSEQTPATSALYAELFPKYLDPELFQVVNGAVPEATKVGAWKNIWGSRFICLSIHSAGFRILIAP